MSVSRSCFQRSLHYAIIGCLIASWTFAPALFAAESPPDSLSNERDYHGIRVGEITCSGNGRTRDGVILQEVLLRPGDPYDPELARETERNLRKLQYIGSAQVIPHYDAERDVVDIEVAVTDRWPWVVLILPTLGGGKTEVEVIFGHTNFFGMGQTVGVQSFYSNQVADSYSFLFSEPRIAGSRVGGTLFVGRQAEVGNRNQVEIWRPLYSLSTKRAYNASFFDWATEHQLFQNGFTVSDYYRRRQGGTLGIRRNFRKGNRRLQTGLSYFYRHDTHRQAPDYDGVIPQDKRRGTVTFDFVAETFEFAKDSYLFLMGPVEDVRLGVRSVIRLGGAAEFLGSDSEYPEMGFTLGWWRGTPRVGYFMFDANFDSRLEDGQLTNVFAGGGLRLYGRVFGRGTMAARVKADMVEKTEDPTQLLLDSPNGLRGYEANSYDGTRRIITNVEWRQPLFRLKGIELGTVLFADGGIIWTEERPITKAPFLMGDGAGVRLGFPGVFSAPVLRLDFAHAVKTDDLEVSFGFGQRF